MIKNFFTIALRTFLRGKVISLIHVVGLSIGISASLIIFLIARHEFGFDNFEPDRERIYRVVMDFEFNGVDGHSAAVPAPLANAVEREIANVEETVPIMQFPGDGTAKGVEMVSLGFLPPAMEGAAFGNVRYRKGNGEEVRENVQVRWGDPNYIRLYRIGLVAGRNIRGGSNIDEVLINETYARMLGFQIPGEAPFRRS